MTDLRRLLEQGEVAEFNRLRPRTAIDLSGIDLSGVPLRGADLGFLTLDRAFLRGTDLRGALLDGASLERADLAGAVLTEARLRDRCNLKYANLSGVLAERADFNGADLTRADLSRGLFTDAVFAFATMFYATLVEARCERADFQRALLAGALLSGAVLRGTNLREARLFQSAGDDVDFTGADLTSAEAVRTHFAGATRFTGAFVKGFIQDGFGSSQDLLGDAIRDREPPAGALTPKGPPTPSVELLDEIPGSDRGGYETALADLEELIGLREVKAYVAELANVMRMEAQRSRLHLPDLETNYHFVLRGSPGTGKTTVARILGRIMHAVGFLKKGHLVETDRAGLVAEYVGQTAGKTQKIVEQAMGGLLFIDEAYALAGAGASDYGAEAVATLLKLMEDRRGQFSVAVAGYTEPMNVFLHSNPGLEDRFTMFIDFPDYSPGELTRILSLMLSKARFTVTPQFLGLASALFFLAREQTTRLGKEFANARFVRNTFQRTWSNAANRLARTPGEKGLPELCTIHVEDLPMEVSLGVPAAPVPLDLLRWTAEGREIGAAEISTSVPFELTPASQQRLRALLADLSPDSRGAQ